MLIIRRKLFGDEGNNKTEFYKDPNKIAKYNKNKNTKAYMVRYDSYNPLIGNMKPSEDYESVEESIIKYKIKE